MLSAKVEDFFGRLAALTENINETVVLIDTKIHKKTQFERWRHRNYLKFSSRREIDISYKIENFEMKSLGRLMTPRYYSPVT